MVFGCVMGSRDQDLYVPFADACALLTTNSPSWPGWKIDCKPFWCEGDTVRLIPEHIISLNSESRVASRVAEASLR